MPKMPQETIDKCESGEASGGGGRRNPVPDGYYELELVEQEEYPDPGSGYGGINLKFEVVRPVGYQGKWVWDRASYNPNSAWKWRSLCDATGYTYDSDSEEMVSEHMIAYVSQEVQTKGVNKGRVNNRIDEYYSLDSEEAAEVED